MFNLCTLYLRWRVDYNRKGTCAGVARDTRRMNIVVQMIIATVLMLVLFF